MKKKYITPAIEVIPMQSASVIAGSTGTNISDFQPGTPIELSYKRQAATAATSTDLEELLNDLLTQ
jgi:hypothetical protein